jgi:ribose 5-phosphate isomerase A
MRRDAQHRDCCCCHEIFLLTELKLSMSSIPTDPIELGKYYAARRAVDTYINHNTKIIGIGSGSTVIYAVGRLVEKIAEEKFDKIICIPTSFQAVQLIIDNKLTLGTLNQYPELDVAIDGADECDDQLNLIKGGGGCQLQEKIIASAAKQFIIIADSRKNSKLLGEQWKTGIPIEVISSAYKLVELKLKQLALQPTLRMAVRKAGPVITDNGNFLIDATFPAPLQPDQLQELNANILSIAGVVETGLFVQMAHVAFFGTAQGEVIVKKRSVQ